VTLTVHLDEDLARHLTEEAARRGISVDQLAAEALADALEQFRRHSGEPTRRRLGFVAVGASGCRRGAAQADELLAEGFGRD